MKYRIEAAVLVLLFTSGIGLAAPPTQFPPGLSAKFKKIMMEFPLEFTCPVVKVGAALGIIPPWTRKDFIKNGVAAMSVYTQPGVTHDSCWCRYQVTSTEVAGSETDFLLVREGTPATPVCQANSTTMSFTCYALKPGEVY